MQALRLHGCAQRVPGGDRAGARRAAPAARWRPRETPPTRTASPQPVAAADTPAAARRLLHRRAVRRLGASPAGVAVLMATIVAVLCRGTPSAIRPNQTAAPLARGLPRNLRREAA